MYLSELKAQHFRQFEDFSMAFNKGLNLLVGENNAGKSSVIDAIRLVLDTTSAEWVNLKSTDFLNGKNELQIQLKFEGLSLRESGLFLEHLTNEEVTPGVNKSTLFITLSAKLAPNPFKKSQFIKTEIRSGINNDGPIIERDVREYLAATYLKPLRDAEAELSAGRSSRLSQILGSNTSLAGDTGATQRIIELLTEASKEIQSDAAIQTAQDNIATLLNSLTFKANVFAPVLSLLGSKDYADMSESEKSFALKSILEKLTLELDASGIKHGLGYSSLLFMATELMLIKQEEDQYPLLLVEEPEAHLHPQLQLKFINYLRTENSQLQCILSTHSPVLASKAPLESLILMQKGQAFPLRKGCTALEDEDYVFLEKFLDSTKANMFFAKGVLLVEGVAEVVLIPKIAELLGRPLEDYGVSLVSVNGLSRKRYAKAYRSSSTSVNPQPLPIKVACITDLDLWPNEAEDTGDNDYGFKTKKQPKTSGKGGNLKYWLNELSPAEIDAKRAKKSEFDGELVKTFISNDWTFEFCLAKYGLSEELYQAINNSMDGYDALNTDAQIRAVQLYGVIEGKGDGKSEVSYSLANILSRYKDRPLDLKAKLPSYIVDAIEYVTEPFPVEME
ncbi:ATP-dependent nuclease [Photobacterium kishitanii]|uniref:ATP-dependent nuclease n=2 Tax=Photobacterium kishitanii TaxID=318456 RepID=UPI0007F87E66|nr:AAA family ATPase [Photobacterium kishitanii]OBU31421.1 ATP-dependent endonuclease [Photobacterium kishitanii]PSW46835.1 ATP-dependent endonuclease [Photobacterium kishitanii]